MDKILTHRIAVSPSLFCAGVLHRPEFVEIEFMKNTVSTMRKTEASIPYFLVVNHRWLILLVSPKGVVINGQVVNNGQVANTFCDIPCYV